jgi:hypothetical protein
MAILLEVDDSRVIKKSVQAFKSTCTSFSATFLAATVALNIKMREVQVWSLPMVFHLHHRRQEVKRMEQQWQQRERWRFRQGQEVGPMHTFENNKCN